MSSSLRCEFDRICLFTSVLPYEVVFRMLLLVTFQYLAVVELSQLILKHVVRKFLVAVRLELLTSVVCFSSVPLPKYHPQALLCLKLRKRSEKVSLPSGERAGEEEEFSTFHFLFPISDTVLLSGKSVKEERWGGQLRWSGVEP